mgnify:CR=1 FL=1
MKLLCSTCFNYTFFEADVEYLRELAVKNGSLAVSDSHFDECNFTDTHFRDSLEDIVNYVIKSDTDALTWNSAKKTYENKYIVCSGCGSSQVTIPYCKLPYSYQSLEDELRENQNEYQQIRRKRNGNKLPVLWKPK